MMRIFVPMVLSAVLGAQQTWIVDCSGGPSADFSDLPPAVAAAAPGDTIYLISGLTCSRFTNTLIDKPLRIVGLNAAFPASATNPARVAMRNRMRIANIPAGEQVIISNCSVIEDNTNSVGLEIANCAGAVVLEYCYFRDLFGVTDQTLRITNCADVTLRGCTIERYGFPLEVTQSTVMLATTTVNPFAGSPTPGLVLTDSTVTMIGSVVNGHSNVNPGEFGAVLYDSLLRIGPGATLAGGTNTFGVQRRAYDVPNLDSTVVEVDPRATLDGDFSDSIPLTPPPTAVAIDAVYHSYAIANKPFGLIYAGPPGGFALLAIGEYGPPVPTPFGDLFLQGPVDAISLVGLPATDGVLVEWLFMPSGVPSGVAYCLQALTLSPTGVFGVTEPSPLVVSWEPGTVP